MGAASLTCDRCRTRLPVSVLNSEGLIACPGCFTPLRFVVFPAYYRAHAPARTGEKLLVEDESSCYYHPAKKAVVPCDGCGRFLCALCDVEFNAKHLCPKCLEAGKEKKTIESLENERPLHDSMALILAVIGLPLAFCAPYVTLFLASAALYISIRHWKKPVSMINDHRGLYVVAILLSFIELGLAVLIFGFMIVGIFFSQ